MTEWKACKNERNEAQRVEERQTENQQKMKKDKWNDRRKESFSMAYTS